MQKMTIKDFWATTKEQKEVIIKEIIDTATKYFDDGDSMSVIIRKTYKDTKYTMQLCDSIIRSSALSAKYNELKAPTRKFKKISFIN